MSTKVLRYCSKKALWWFTLPYMMYRIILDYDYYNWICYSLMPIAHTWKEIEEAQDAWRYSCKSLFFFWSIRYPYVTLHLPVCIEWPVVKWVAWILPPWHGFELSPLFQSCTNNKYKLMSCCILTTYHFW